MGFGDDGMGGGDVRTGELFSYVDLADRVVGIILCGRSG
jgi:hypothetical protein